MKWSQTYPGRPCMVPAARAFVRGMLADSPRGRDAELIASELVGNSLRHTASGDGGEVTVTVEVEPGHARITVRDAGAGDWQPLPGVPPDEDDHGRGLLIVYHTADKIGHDVTEDGQTTWAELTWSAES
ncbi:MULTISPECIES: ATP-binding protein [unclassified Spirillospora]|uniref:ATP-binding protein n=1 Tax=unclassified Spirillospora TaxID=2642701 RepID=UPI00371AC074